MAESKIAELYNIPIPEFVFFSALQTFGKPLRFSVQNTFFPQQISAHAALLPCGQQTRAIGFSSHPLTTSFEKAARMQPMREGGTILKKVPDGAPGFSAFRWTNAIGALIKIIPHNFKIVKSDTHYLVDIPKKNSFGSSLCTRKKDVSQRIFCTAAPETHIP